MDCIDFHAHILPHMDHGCANLSMSVRQVDMLAQAGVHSICATSHFYPHRKTVSAYLEAREAAAHELAHALKREVVQGCIIGDATCPTILPGAEVLICKGMEHMERLDELCLCGTNLLLLEMPLSADLWDKTLLHTVIRIADSGLCPVMAHVDRYPQTLMQPLLEAGIPGQINADALARLFPKSHLLYWIQQGYIVAMGSDLHGDQDKGIRPWKKALKKRSDQIDKIMQKTGALLEAHQI